MFGCLSVWLSVCQSTLITPPSHPPPISTPHNPPPHHTTGHQEDEVKWPHRKKGKGPMATAKTNKHQSTAAFPGPSLHLAPPFFVPFLCAAIAVSSGFYLSSGGDRWGTGPRTAFFFFFFLLDCTKAAGKNSKQQGSRERRQEGGGVFAPFPHTHTAHTHTYTRRLSCESDQPHTQKHAHLCME